MPLTFFRTHFLMTHKKRNWSEQGTLLNYQNYHCHLICCQKSKIKAEKKSFFLLVIKTFCQIKCVLGEKSYHVHGLSPLINQTNYPRRT